MQNYACMVQPYVCIRCGYETHRKSSMYNHLFKKLKPCPQTKNSITLTDYIKQYILDNRRYVITYDELDQESQFSRPKYVLQHILEKFLGGTRKALPCGLTDVTTETCHAEIDDWENWQKALGNLICYKVVDPRDTLLFFGCGNFAEGKKAQALQVLSSCGINVFEMIEDGDNICIRDCQSRRIVYNYTYT